MMKEKAATYSYHTAADPKVDRNFTAADDVFLHHLLSHPSTRDKMTFEVMPTQLTFWDFTPNLVYEASIQFKNRTKTTQFVRIVKPESRFFSISPPRGSTTTLKVSSGLSVTYKVRFTPEAGCDYNYDLQVITDHERYTIPVRAYISRGHLELPSLLELNESPLKGSSTTPVFLRNNGDDACIWRATANHPFALTPTSGTVPPHGGVSTLEVSFTPHTFGEHSGSLLFFLGPEGDVCQELPMRGMASEVNVSINTDRVDFVDTSVTLEREAIVRVENNSDHILKFSWRSEESESAERIALRNSREEKSEDNNSILNPLCVFDSDVFSIMPSNGVIYGRGTREFTVIFRPQLATEYISTAYLDIDGRRERFPLRMKGVGLAPLCSLEFTKLNVGDVFMNALHEYAIDLENKGCVEARYTVLPSDSLMGSKFTFMEPAGVLGPWERQTLHVQLRSDLLGVIYETFYIHLHGSTENLTIQFKGRVVGPTFQFDVGRLDFGNVSYNFWHSRSFHIVNTSKVSMHYHLHLPEGTPFANEFEISPSDAVILPSGTQQVQVEFLANTIGEYNTSIVVDVDDVGDCVDMLPIKAACMVPPIRAQTEKIDFGNCFVGRDYIMNVEIINDTTMSAKFKVICMEDNSWAGKADLQIGDPTHEGLETIEPKRKMEIPIMLRPLEVGALSFSLYLKVLGSSGPPQPIFISAVGRGPNVEVHPTTLSFGTIQVLQDSQLEVKLTNTSPIPAEFSLSISRSGNQNSRENGTGKGLSIPAIFRVEPESGEIEPYGTFSAFVIACLDEAMPYKDELILSVKHAEAGQATTFPFSATGTGFALVPAEDLNPVDVGDVFTDTTVEKEITIHNKGRRDKEVLWNNVRGGRAKQGDPPIAFYIKPERTTIPAWGSITFKVTGLVSELGSWSEDFALKMVGSFKEILTCKVIGNFIKPLLAYSSRTIEFKHTHDPDSNQKLEKETKTFTMKNVSSKELRVCLKLKDESNAKTNKVVHPFSVCSTKEFALPSGETKVVGISCDPYFKGDWVSQVCKAKLLVTFSNHSHKESVSLVARINFPTLSVEGVPDGLLDFGTILRDTEERRELVLVNNSTVVPAHFSWKLTDDSHGPPSGLDENKLLHTKRFDFLPFRGVIPPGASQPVKAVFYGSAGTFGATAECLVDGGKSTLFRLKGRADDMQIYFDRTSIDFGVLEYFASATQRIVMHNPSNVAASFHVSLVTLKNPKAVRVTPMSGTVKDKVTFDVTFCPHIPDEIVETFFIQVGPYDPQSIKVHGMGQLNTMMVDLVPETGSRKSITAKGPDKVVSLSRHYSPAYKVCHADVSSRFRNNEIVPYYSRTSNLTLTKPLVDLVALEAERLAFCLDLAVTDEAKRLKESPLNISIEDGPLLDVSGSLNLDEEEQLGVAEVKLRRVSATAKGSMKYILARYTVDFGHMTRADRRTANLRLINTCPNILFIVIDSKEIEKYPLEINPAKIPKIPPLQELTFAITLDASDKSRVSQGENSYEVVLDIKGGPAIILTVRCFVATPTLKMSETAIDFGDILLGRAKVMPLVFTNEQAVTCEWRLSVFPGKKETSEDGKTDTFPPVEDIQNLFWCSAMRGTLAPGEETTVNLHCAPIARGAFCARLQVRFLSNPKKYEVMCVAQGITRNVEFVPPHVEFPIVRPFNVSHSTFSIVNHEDYPVELVSLNLDQRHRNEITILRKAIELSQDGRLLMPPRDANELLPENVVDRVYRQMKQDEERCQLIQPSEEENAEQGGNDSQQIQANNLLSQKTKKYSKRATSSRRPGSFLANSATGNPLDAKQDGARKKPQAFVLLLGPPQASKSSQVSLLESNGFQPVSWNELLKQEAELDTASGEIVRNLFTFIEGREQDVDSDLDSLIRSPPKEEPTKSKEEQQCLECLPRILRDSLMSFVKDAIEVVGASQFVMDDLSCRLTCDRELMLQTVIAVCKLMGIPLYILPLAVSEATVGLRIATTHQDLCRKRMEEATLTPLSEEEYEALPSNEEREAYNVKLRYYNQCRREYATATKKRERYDQILAAEPQKSVEEEIENELQSEEAALEATVRGAKKSTKGAPQPEIPKIQWETLSPMDGFKELYRRLRKEYGNFTLVPPTKQGPPTLWKYYLHVVNGEGTTTDVTQGILEAISTITQEIAASAVPPTKAERGKSTTSSASVSPSGSPAREKAPPNAAEGFPSAETTKLDTTTISEAEDTHEKNEEINSPYGEWTYADASRLTGLEYNSIQYYRFFSTTEREMTLQTGKKQQKNNKAPPISEKCTQIEEMTRWIIPAKSSVDVIVEFCCDEVGTHRAQCTFSIAGTSQIFNLSLAARAALPEINRDERSIFSTVIPRPSTKGIFQKVFILSKRLFEFGPLLIPGPAASISKNRKKSDRVTSVLSQELHKATRSESFTALFQDTLTVSNAGVCPAEVSLCFTNDKDKTFSVAPNKLTLPIGGSQTVTLSAAPEVVGPLINRLLIAIKDNPNPWTVDVSCVGSRPAVTLNELKECTINFGRSVINRSTEETVIVTNTSSMPIKWQLQQVDKLPHELTVEPPTAVLPEGGSLPVKFTFAPTNTCVHNITLKMDVTDPDQPGIIYESLPVILKAEGHDVVLEWTKEIDFKVLHVGETKKEVIRILNKSPYAVNFLIRLPKRLFNYVTISPCDGVIRGTLGHKDAAFATIDVTACFNQEGEIPPKLGLLEVAFFDATQNELLYPLQTIPVRGEAYYTKFSVRPTSIDFGSCFFNQHKQCSFELRNTGRFPVNFQLFDYKEGVEALQALLAENALANATEGKGKGAQGKHANRQDLDLRIGCFTITPSKGVVNVGEWVQLVASAVPIEGERSRETLGIYVDQSEPELAAKGLPFELVAHPATPGIFSDLQSSGDVETVFEEQQIVHSLDQFDKTVRAYGKDDRAFSYGRVLVGRRVEERFRLANSSPVSCIVQVYLLPLNAGMAKEKKEVKVEGFDLSMERDLVPANPGHPTPSSMVCKVTLPPFESRFVTVGFTPKALQSFGARFSAVVESGTDPRTNHLYFDLKGEGMLPFVEIKLPPPLTKPKPIVKSGSFSSDASNANKTGKQKKESLSRAGKRTNSVPAYRPDIPSVSDSLDMPLTLVGMSSSRQFSVKNIGGINADIRVTVLSMDDEANGLSLLDHSREVTIPVGGEEIFEVVYAPKEVGHGKLRLKVALLDNPFEDKELVVNAESFSQPVSFEGIDPSSYDYLSMGDCYLGEPKTTTIKIRNSTDKSIRFEWGTPTPMINFKPSVGHMDAGISKSITVTLSCPEEGRDMLPCTLSVRSIECTEPVEWDNSLVNNKWVVVDDENMTAYVESGRRSLRKVLEPVPEPSYTEIPDFNFQTTLNVGYTCDNPSYKLSVLDDSGKESPVEALAFTLTKMYQRRVAHLRLTNTGPVALPFSLIVTGADASSGANPEIDFVPDINVFSVDPSDGSVPVGKHTDISVTFAPNSVQEVSQMLTASFPFSKHPLLHIPLRGMGECPLVHFQIPSSDYLKTRVEGEVTEEIDPETRVIEIVARGLHTRTPFKFKVLNPTNSSYMFEWVDKTPSGIISPFRCTTPSGNINAGRQLEMGFEFSADTLGVRESTWSFYIQGKSSIPFMLIGRATEPNVLFNQSKLNFDGVTVGNKVERILMLENRDEIPFSFTFGKNEVAALSSFLSVKPISATIGPKEKIPISITFSPKEETEYNSSLICTVKKASIPLTVNIKGEGICIHDNLVVENPGSESGTQTVPPGKAFTLNLGRVQVDDTVTRRFILSNDGQCPFDFVLGSPEHRFITIDTRSGNLAPRQRAVINFTYSPTSEESLRQHRISIKVAGKIQYSLVVSAVSYVPKLHLSSEKVEFGPRFIACYMAPGSEHTTSLLMTNNDKNLITVDCSISDGNDWCTLEATSFVIRPSETCTLVLTFLPTDVRMYDDNLKLLLNGSYPLTIPISGEGVAPRVDVNNRICKLGVARVGEKRSAEIKIECRSVIPTSVSFEGCIDDELRRKGVSISPSEMFVMKPRENRTITAYYKPLFRMGEFQKEVRMLVCGKELPFAVFCGSCEDAEVHLDSTCVTFPDIVIGSSGTQKVALMNSGDISQKFNWSVKTAGGEISVHPPSGFLRAHSELHCEVRYSPHSADSILRCQIEVEFDESPALSLRVEANSVARAPAKEIVQFRCKARETDVQKVVVENLLPTVWNVEPVFDNPLWTIQGPLSLKPKSSAPLTIVYSPMAPTAKDTPDEGTMFISQPDSTGFTYALKGYAGTPGPSAPLLERTIEASATHTEKLIVHNWSPFPLRFAREVKWTPPQSDNLVNLKGPSCIDVPAKTQKEYSLGFTCTKEGVYRGAITFRCPEHEEMYQFYEIALNVSGKTASVNKADLAATVRTASTYTISLFNSTSKPAIVACKLEGNPDGITFPATYTIQPKSAGNLPVVFFPLVHKEYASVKIIVTCQELNVSATHVINLKSLPGRKEKLTRLTCPLGQTIVFPLRFIHYSKTNTEFAVHTTSGRLMTPGGNAKSSNSAASASPFTKVGGNAPVKVLAGPGNPTGQEVSVEFFCEPTCIGYVNERIEFTSPSAGTYTFPIIMQCTAPQRQGPFSAKPGQTTAIPFKNVFTDPITISIATDSPCFIVAKKTELIGPKKAITIPVQFKPETSEELIVRGKLILSCTPPSEKAPIEWIYYLEGLNGDAGGGSSGRSNSFAGRASSLRPRNANKK